MLLCQSTMNEKQTHLHMQIFKIVAELKHSANQKSSALQAAPSKVENVQCSILGLVPVLEMHRVPPEFPSS